MAAVTPTIETINKAGNHWIVVGTVAASTTANESSLGSHVIYCNMACTTDDATNDIRVDINVEDDFSTASEGLVAFQSEATDTYRFTAGVLL